VLSIAVAQRCSKRDGDQRDLGSRVGIGERSADGAAPSGRCVPDPRHGGREQRHLGANERIALDDALTGRGADRDGVGLIADVSEPGKA
jgi:hypothetical protein